MGRPRSWTGEEDTLIREQYTKLTAQQIADALGRGRSASGVRERASRLGILSGRQSYGLTKEEAERAAAMLRAGWLLRSVAVEFNRSINDFGRQLKRAGVDASAIRKEGTAARRAARKPSAKVKGVGSVKQGKRRAHGRNRPMAAPIVRDHSLPALAADHLRRDYAPVFHRGREDTSQCGIWQVGSKCMAEADMIALARSKGFGRDVAPIAAPVIPSSILSPTVHRGTMQPPAGYNRGWLPPVKTMFERRA